MNKILARLKTVNQYTKVKDVKERFEINLKDWFEKLEDDVTADNFSGVMKEEATWVAGKTKKEPPACQKKIKKSNK